jgi:hypothetical protein
MSEKTEVIDDLIEAVNNLRTTFGWSGNTHLEHRTLYNLPMNDIVEFYSILDEAYNRLERRK